MKKFIAVAAALVALFMIAGAAHAQEAQGNSGIEVSVATFSVDSLRYAYVYDARTYDDPEATVRFQVLQTPVVVPASEIDRFVAFHRASGVDVVIICRLHPRSDGSYETLRSQGRPIGCQEFR